MLYLQRVLVAVLSTWLLWLVLILRGWEVTITMAPRKSTYVMDEIREILGTGEWTGIYGVVSGSGFSVEKQNKIMDWVRVCVEELRTKNELAQMNSHLLESRGVLTASTRYNGCTWVLDELETLLTAQRFELDKIKGL